MAAGVVASIIASFLAFGLSVPAAAASDGFSVVYSFQGAPDGYNPSGGLTLASNGRLYGTTLSGGCYAPRTVFGLDQNGGTYSVLHSFFWTVATPPCGAGSHAWGDGGDTYAPPADLGDGWLYGTTPRCFFCASDSGDIYRIRPDGSTYQIVYDFGPDSVSQLGPPSSFGTLLKASDGKYYGTAVTGGAGNCGGVFRLDPATDPPSYANVAALCAPGVANPPAHPFAGLIQGPDGNLYGTSKSGGANNLGAVFKVVVDPGSGLGTVTTLHSLSYADSTNGNGIQEPLVLGLDGAMYGTTDLGVFRITTDGTYTGVNPNIGWGHGPQIALVPLADGTFIGGTWGGGANNNGTVFAMDTCGNINYLHSIDGPAAGGIIGNLVAVGSTVWGVTQSGGSANFGTIWKENVPAGAIDTVQLAASPASAGSPVTLTATVSGQATNGQAQSATVTFFDGQSPLGTAQLASGQASLAVPSLGAGSHQLSARYCGIRSPAVSESVAAGTSTSVVSDTNPTVVGQAVTFTATVSSTAGIPTGAVSFADGTTTLGSASLDTTGKASLVTSSLGAGSRAITASYGGAPGYGASSGNLTQQVNLPGTTTTVASSANPSTYGDPVTFTATVSSPAGVPTGQISFTDGTTPLGTATLDPTGKASLLTAALGAGPHTITATYGGDTNYSASASGPLAQSVKQAASTTAVVSSANPSTFGNAVTFTATVSSPAGTPTGQVTFTDGTITLGTVALGAGGQAALSTATLGAGAHSVTATYGGDTNFSGSNAALTQTVGTANSSTAVVSSKNPATFGDSVTLTATVSSPAGTPTGQVSFTDGTTTLGSANLDATGHASLVVPGLGAADHPITATYNGDPNHSGSSAGLTETVQRAASSTAVVSSENPATFGDAVTFTATVSSPAGVPTGQISFTDGTTPLGTATLDPTGKASLLTAALGAGPHTITATYGGDTNYSASASGPLAQSVKQAASKTSVVSSPNPSSVGESVTFTATVSSPAEAPSGTVTFTDGSGPLGTGTINTSGQAKLTTSGLGAGAHSIVAAYAGTANTAGSSSAPLTQTVNQPTPTTPVGDALVYTGTSGPIANRSSATLRAVLRRADNAAAIAGRSVKLTLGAGSSAQTCTAATDATGTASCSPLTAIQPLGPGTVTAAFAGDSSYQASTASAATLIYTMGTGGPGIFVIGDQNARVNNAVTFWGEKWWQADCLSGGPAPSSFKGFALNSSGPAIGSTWSTDPGASSPPPAGPLPTYMGVIVTSSSWKVGTQVFGNTVHIAVIKTNTGYQPDAGHTGTGTVVAVV